MIRHASVSRGSVVAPFVSGFAAAVAAYVLYKFMNKKSRRQRARCAPAASSIMDLVGNTPMVELRSLSAITGCRVLAKLEYCNPSGSSKDRVGKQIIEEAEREGTLASGGTIVEGTSGSTGISLSTLARARGYGSIIVMPDDQAREKRDILYTLGAQVQLVKPVSIVHPNHYVNAATALARQASDRHFANQFETLANFRVHYNTTGPEIWEQTGGAVDGFVMGAGTGGMIAGVSSYLKDKKPGVVAALIDPQGSSLFHRVNSGIAFALEQAERRLKRHRYDTIVEGIGIDRVTKNFEMAKLDKAYRGSDQDAVDMARFLMRHEGLFIGSSSALHAVGALWLARDLGPGHTVVTVLCDTGHRHLTRFWSDEYLKSVNLRPRLTDVHISFFDDARREKSSTSLSTSSISDILAKDLELAKQHLCPKDRTPQK